MMRRVICLLLALALCLSLSVTAMAAVVSPGQDGTSPTVPGGDDVPDTGDNASLGLWLFLLLLALLVLVLVIVGYRKYMKQ